jgi:hypothetical protein
MPEHNFYCIKKCGDPEFSIKKWNELFKLGIEENKTPCKIQCEKCMNIVLDTQIKNKKH